MTIAVSKRVRGTSHNTSRSQSPRPFSLFSRTTKVTKAAQFHKKLTNFKIQISKFKFQIFLNNIDKL